MLCTLKQREICAPVGLMQKAIEVGRFSLETAFIIQEKEFIVLKTYHADKQKGKYERFVSPKMGCTRSSTRSSIVVAR